MQPDGAPIQVPSADQQRIADAWRLRMILEGAWRHLLAEHGERQLGPLRARLVGEWDTSANLFSSLIDQTSTMYDEQPEQQSPDTRSLDAISRAFKLGRWWETARDHQRYVRGLMEALVYVGWDDERAHPTFEIVAPDEVIVEASPSNRSRPVTVWRMRERTIGRGPDGQPVKRWFWDRWSVAGGVGSFSVWSSDRSRDVTATWFDPAMWSGPAYPYRDDDGRPILPFALYHAKGSGKGGLWHPNRHHELVFGTLQVGVLWTAMVHGFLRASWDQRVLLNGRVRGGAVERAGNTSIRTITPDPTSILEVDSTGGEQAAIGAWGASIDISAAEETVRRYEARLAVHAGMSPADVQIESFSPTSGAAITVSRRGLRTIALRDRVHFRLGDLELTEVVAAMLRAHGVACSARAYRYRYRGLDLEPSEREAVSRYVGQEIDLGLLDRVGAYQELHPGTDATDAEADLLLQDQRRLRDRVVAELLAPAPVAAPPPAPAPPPPAAV